MLATAFEHGRDVLEHLQAGVSGDTGAGTAVVVGLLDLAVDWGGLAGALELVFLDQ